MLNKLNIDWQLAKPHKISIKIKNHATSFSLEKPFYEILKKQAKKHNISLAAIIREIDAVKAENIGLSSALRLYILKSIESDS